MSELVKLRQEQQNTRAYIQAMEERIQGTEQKQQQMMTFLARAMQNPVFIQRLIQQKERRRELEEAIGKKRRRPIDRGHENGSVVSCGNQYPEVAIKIEAGEYEDYETEASELEDLAFEMRGPEENDEDDEEQVEQTEQGKEGTRDKELNDEFWDELLSDGIVEEPGNDGIT
uniref:Heat stress transcription factor A-2b n=1 Tax=Anthurium amnicola TaxID=1678845 RepID=A0A1D1YC64_9ARAE